MSLFDPNLESQMTYNISLGLLGKSLKFKGLESFVLDIDGNGIKTIETFIQETGQSRDYCPYKGCNAGWEEGIILRKYYQNEVMRLDENIPYMKLLEDGWEHPSYEYFCTLFGNNHDESFNNIKLQHFLDNMRENKVYQQQFFSSQNDKSGVVWTSNINWKNHKVYSYQIDILKVYQHNIHPLNQTPKLRPSQYGKVQGVYSIEQYTAHAFVSNPGIPIYHPIMLIHPYNKQYNGTF